MPELRDAVRARRSRDQRRRRQETLPALRAGAVRVPELRDAVRARRRHQGRRWAILSEMLVATAKTLNPHVSELRRTVYVERYHHGSRREGLLPAVRTRGRT